MAWKVALYDFIHARNRTEVDYDWQALRAAVADETFLNGLRLLHERRRRLHRERSVTPVRSETRLSIRRAEASEGRVTAELLLHRQLHSRMKGIPIEEEAVEAERVTLKELPGGRWMVTNVSPVIPIESASEAGAGDTLAAGAGAGLWPISTPPPLISSSWITPGFERKPNQRYNRELVRQYAERWWNSYNPSFIHFDVDCSNYVSQCILAGGIPMDYTGRREAGWWYRGRSGGQELWSFSWAVANALQVYLGSSKKGGLLAEAVASPKELKIGDVISYSWEGDGRFGHSTIVTGFDPDGMPLVNAHTVNSRNRYWDYSDSYAWTERTKYRFFHIQD
jgi:hypothetical protein